MQGFLSFSILFALLAAIVLLFVGIIRAIMKKKSGKVFAAMGICFAYVLLGFVAIGIIVSVDSASKVKVAAATATTVRAETESEYKNSCVHVFYETLSRNPENYIGQRIYTTGEISQLVSNDGYMLYEDSDSSGDTYMTMRWYIGINHPESNRILEGDTVIFYGEFRGIKNYTSVLGAGEEAMGMKAKYYEITQN